MIATFGNKSVRRLSHEAAEALSTSTAKRANNNDSPNAILAVISLSYSTEWPRGDSILNVPLATVNTVVLITSSVTMVMAWASLKRNDFGKFRFYQAATVLAGLVFLVIKYFEYSAKFHHGLLPSTNTFLAIYFTLTGLHGLHVIGGMAINGYLWGPGAKLWKTDPEHFTNRVENSGLFWHFVDLVWIFLFPVLYLL